MKPRQRETTTRIDKPEEQKDAHVERKSRFSPARAKDRHEKTLPADRGAHEQESLSQGSE
jgi:hypothetical protein